MELQEFVAQSCEVVDELSRAIENREIGLKEAEERILQFVNHISDLMVQEVLEGVKEPFTENRIKVDATYVVPITRFDREEYIHSRVKKLDRGASGSLSTTLRYLYFTAGPTKLPADRFKASVQHLDKAELILAKWLKTRTNGNLRKFYGKEALRAARSATSLEGFMNLVVWML